MDIRQLDQSALAPENGANVKRLLPWAELNAPFEGCWAVVPPGGASLSHAHHEYEIFIAVDGTAVLESDGRRTAFATGDVARFSPHTPHRVVNESDSDFTLYCIWWDPEMAGRFVARHRAEDGS